MKSRIIFLSICIFLALSLTILATYSWIAPNKNVGGNGIDINVKPASSITSTTCYALKYDGITKASYVLLDDEEEAITMSEYDTIFTDRNVNTPLIIRIVLLVPKGLAMDQNTYISLKFPCSNTYKENNKVANKLSNVAIVKCGCGLTSSKVKDTYGNEVNNNNKISIFNGAIEALETNDAITDNFFDGTGNSKTKASLAELKLHYSDYSMYIPNDVSNIDNVEIIINIEINYDPALIGEYINSYGSAEAPGDFLADIGTIYIDLESN
ncbi:MAG: hypothetical protein J6X93_00065 [Bacilli bacterium]|nr:hypothetical protein [Bacilli bacterium]